MATERSPWYRASKDAWFVQFQGKQVCLAKGKDNRHEAMTAFYKLMSKEAETPPVAKIRTIQVCDLFLQWSEKHHEKVTFDWHKYFLTSFCKDPQTARLLASELKPFHCTRWLDANPGWKGARRSAIGVLKRAFSWAEAEGITATNPFKRIKVPAVGSRRRVLTVEERHQIRDAIDDPKFSDFVTALEETGCRPGEVARVTAAEVDLTNGVWTLAKHKTAKKTGKPRVIYLTPKMVELTTRLVASFPEGPIFRGKANKPYTKNAIICRFRRLREKLPQISHFISYSFRSTYATNALENGVGIAQVAELLGHTSTDMVMRHYGHLSQKVQHMREMAAKATCGLDTPAGM